MLTPPLRVAIAGAGLMGQWHAYAARRAGARVVAIVDCDRPQAERLAARYRGCRAYRELAESLDAVDVVHVCTPVATHARLARQSLEARRHVLVEKPMAPTAVAVADLLDRAAANSVLLCPAHQFLFQDGVEAALARLPAVGPLRHIDFTICSAGARGTAEATRDRIALEILPHPLSLLMRVAPAMWSALDWSIRHPAAGEIRTLTQVGDMTASICVSMGGRPTVNRMRLIGLGGTIHVDLFHGFGAALTGTVSRVDKLGRPFTENARLAGAAAANLAMRVWRREPAYPGLRRLLERFYGAVAHAAPCPITPAEVLEVARTCDRLGALLAEVPIPGPPR